MRPQLLAENQRRQRLLGIAALWLVAGSFLLMTTLIPLHSALLGWTPLFWLVVAPLVVMLTLEPSLPRQLLALRLPRRHAPRAVMWR